MKDLEKFSYTVQTVSVNHNLQVNYSKALLKLERAPDDFLCVCVCLYLCVFVFILPKSWRMHLHTIKNHQDSSCVRGSPGLPTKLSTLILIF